MHKAMNKLHDKLKASIIKHGNWDDYNEQRMWSKIDDELEEVEQALIEEKMIGDHSVADELLDVAVTCVKMSAQLTKRYDQQSIQNSGE